MQINQYHKSLKERIGMFVVTLLAISYLTLAVAEGPIRHYLAIYGMNEFVYIPKLGFILMVIFYPLFANSINKGALIILSVILLSLIWGLINLNSSSQVLFGVWVLCPIFFALLYGSYFNFHSFRGVFFLLFIMAISGVLMDPFFEYPWEGSSVAVFGNDLTVSRTWTMLGIDREAGFSRASFSAASQILVLAIILMYFFKHRSFTRVFIWSIAIIAIILTTSKGIILCWVLLSFFYLSKSFTVGTAIIDFSWHKITVISGLVMILLPLVSGFVVSVVGIDTSGNFNYYGSLVDRFINTWPKSTLLLGEPPSSQWLFGRGIGGVGSAQFFFEINSYLPADNLFLYLMITFGLPGSIIFIIYLLRFARSFRSTNFYNSLLVPLSLSVFIYGMVNSVLEEAFYSFLFFLILQNYKNNMFSPARANKT